ncbi:hypothetical protein BGW37DRAFT_533556 [Umbelopsis sp. PMI_123]|nr:hypothetical protein BGW37DRAFT_533556 [Umbelopsis sp. PMI_123]
MDENVIDDEAQYQAIRHNDKIWRVPIRNINEQKVLLLSDIQSFIPSATGVVSNDKLVPFVVDQNTGAQLLPKRIEVITAGANIWDILFSETNDQDTSTRIAQLESKYEDLINRLDRLLPASDDACVETSPLHYLAVNPNSNSRTQLDEDITETLSSDGLSHENDEISEGSNDNVEVTSYAMDTCEDVRHPSNSVSHLSIGTLPQRTTTAGGDPDEPPSYENSILGNIRTLTERLLEFEAHIGNRHKSPRWLTERNEWLSRTPGNLEQFAIHLVELEMALLWTAVAESWINERETWLNLVMNARSLRHLAGALISLERHTLVLDEEWPNVRERWVNELLEMLVLPYSHS